MAIANDNYLTFNFKKYASKSFFSELLNSIKNEKNYVTDMRNKVNCYYCNADLTDRDKYSYTAEDLGRNVTVCCTCYSEYEYRINADLFRDAVDRSIIQNSYSTATQAVISPIQYSSMSSVATGILQQPQNGRIIDVSNTIPTKKKIGLKDVDTKQPKRRIDL